MKTPFLPEHDEIIRDVYPLFGSKGVINLLPQCGYKPRQVNMRACGLGVRYRPYRQGGGIAHTKQSDGTLAPVESPARLRSDDIYPDARHRLAYIKAWR